MTSYASCWWLQDHLEFSYDNTVHACCYGYPRRKSGPTSDRTGAANDWEEVGHIYLCHVKDNKFPYEVIRQKRQELHAMIAKKSSEADVCLECPVLSIQEWSERQYLVKNITLNTWLHCNLKCEYCFVAHPDFKPSTISYDLHAVMTDMLRGGHFDPKGDVTWGGGDISAYPEFNHVSQLFIAHGIHQNFKTSGFKFLRGVAEALEKKLGLVEVSVDAGTPETYARIKGKDVYNQVVSNLIEYSKSGDVQLKYIVTKDNVGKRDVDGFLDLVRLLKSKNVVFTPEWTQCHNGAYNDEQLASIAKLIDSTRELAINVRPVNHSDGDLLFPSGMWSRLKPFLTSIPAQESPSPAISTTFRGNMNSNPLVSIIIPVYNGADYLAQAIDSALAQTYKNIEIIVVNDGSADNGKTESVAKSYGDRIRYFSKRNGNAGSALNEGIRQMRGEFFSWLSHDDLYYPNKTERQIAKLAELGKNNVILYSDFDIVDEDLNQIAEGRAHEVPPEFFRYHLTLSSYLHGCSLLIPKSAFDKCGLFNERLRTTQDYDLWFKMSFFYEFTQMHEKLIKGRRHKGQGTQTMKDYVVAENNDMLSHFMEHIPHAELREASGRSLPGAYLKLAKSFIRRGYYRACRKGVKLALLAKIGVKAGGKILDCHANT